MHPTQEIISEIRALSSHYPKRARSAADEERWLSDWATDLGAYDPMDVRLACAQWRAGDSNRMPTPGELIAKCRQLVKPEIVHRQRVEALARLPREFVRSPAETERMRLEVAALAAEFANARKIRGPLERKPGETATQQAERLWPSHRADRIKS